jgi:hypothetical protein
MGDVIAFPERHPAYRYLDEILAPIEGGDYTAAEGWLARLHASVGMVLDPEQHRQALLAAGFAALVDVERLAE